MLAVGQYEEYKMLPEPPAKRLLVAPVFFVLKVFFHDSVKIGYRGDVWSNKAPAEKNV